MSYLTHRAERALLGALLADQPLPPDLQPDSFGYHLHRAVYAAVAEARAEQRDLHGDAHLAAVAARVGLPEVDTNWLRSMRDDCPKPGHAAMYARMVDIAAFRRDIAAHAERIAINTTDMTELADALAQQVDVNAPLTASDELPPSRVPAARRAGSQAPLEDALLAGLLRHPEQAREVAVFLPAEALGDPARREVYQAILSLADAAEPIDEITVAWELARQRAETRLFPERPDRRERSTQADDEPDLGSLERLAAASAPATPVESARTLLAGNLRAAYGVGRVRPELDVAPRPTLDPGLRRPPTPNGGPLPRIDR
jgi:hypothetical protein